MSVSFFIGDSITAGAWDARGILQGSSYSGGVSPMSTLISFGSSSTAGAWDLQGGGWANRLGTYIHSEVIKAQANQTSFWCLPYNLGVSGNTAENLIARVESEIKARIEGDSDAIQLVYSIGTNDSIYMLDQDKPRFTDQAFESNIRQLIEISRQFTGYISFIGLLPVQEELLNPIPWAPTLAYQNARIKNFETIIGQVCQQEKIAFLPQFDRWINMPDYHKFLFDGVHPNSDGHALLADQIKEFLITDKFYKFHS
jgi:lysophospholipase L1-like esterase